MTTKSAKICSGYASSSFALFASFVVTLFVKDGIITARPRLPEPIDDPRLREIVRRHFQLHAIARGETDESLAHFARDVREHEVLVRQLHAKHGSGEDGRYFTLDFDDIVLNRHNGIN